MTLPPVFILKCIEMQRMRVFCATFYHLATPQLAAGALAVEIYKGEKFSDHAPVTVEYDWAC